MITDCWQHEWDGPKGFDPFTPYLRIISLGGMKVHQGAWTCMEVFLALAHRATGQSVLEEIFVQEEGRFYAQFNGLRATLETSLVGLSRSWLGIVWVDARHSSEWVEQSTQSALDELAIWQNTRAQQKLVSPLEVFIWVEESNHESERSKIKPVVYQALNRIKRFCQHIRVGVISEIYSHISFSDEMIELDRILERLKHEFSATPILVRAELEQDNTTLVDYIDDMVLIPSGLFYQGGPKLSASVERPRHQVKISRPFWVGQTPVTHRLWERVMNDSGRGHVSGLEPVTDMSWFEALQFCNRLSEQCQLEPVYEIENHDLPKVMLKTSTVGFRLLTESEWEYACLGGRRTSLTTPPLPVAPAWTQQRSQLKVHPVAQLASNQWGLYDCLGNVAEWCQDEYRFNIYKDRGRLTVDPCEYHSDDGERVIRGGSFDSAEYLVTPSHRDACRPQKRWSSIGFRIAKSCQD